MSLLVSWTLHRELVKWRHTNWYTVTSTGFRWSQFTTTLFLKMTLNYSRVVGSLCSNRQLICSKSSPTEYFACQLARNTWWDAEIQHTVYNDCIWIKSVLRHFSYNTFQFDLMPWWKILMNRTPILLKGVGQEYDSLRQGRQVELVGKAFVNMSYFGLEP